VNSRKNIFVIVIVEEKNVLDNLSLLFFLLNLHWINKIRTIVGFEVIMSKFREALEMMKGFRGFGSLLV
jgi:hypothetical protein